MPEYSSTTITPADGVKVPAMNGGSSGNFQLDALRNFILASKGQANGLASLGADGKLTAAQLPDLADDVLVYGSYALLPNPGIEGKLYITADTNEMYRWDGTQYVVLSVDLSAYATKAEMEAADTDLKNAIDSTNARVENLEQEHGGYYDVDVKSVYTIPSGKAKNWSVNVLRGVTRTSNQLESDWTFTDANNWAGRYCSVACSSNVATVTVTEAGTERGLMSHSNHSMRYIGGHYYLISVEINPDVNGNMGISINGSIDAPKIAFSSGTWTRISSILLPSTSVSGRVYFLNVSSMSVGQQMKFRNMIIRDLNIYFGGSIPSDADTIAEIQQNYPELLVPSDYGNSLLSTTYEGIKSLRANHYSGAKSFEVQANGTYYSDYIPVTAGTKMTVSLKASRISGATVTNVNLYPVIVVPYIGSTEQTRIPAPVIMNFPSSGTVDTSFTFTVPTSVTQIRLYFGNNNGDSNVNTLKTNFFLEVGDSHMESTLTLPTPVTLRSAGSVADEFDLESGEKTNPIGSYTFDGTETWYFYSSPDNRFFFKGLSDVIKKIPVNEVGNVLLEGFTPQSAGTQYSQHNEYSVATDNNGIVFIYVASWVGKTPAEVASLMAGRTLNYELATPDAPTQLDPIQNPYLPTESGGTISSILTDAVDDSMTLGYINL